MLAEILQDRAALYVSGEMSAAEREAFEVLLESRPELQKEMAALRETAVAVVMTQVPPVLPPPEMQARLLAAVDALPPEPPPDALVVTDAAGRLEWFNPAFTAMCGYDLAELKGQKPGLMLQGPATDPGAVGRIREALRAGRGCRETLVNYHKNGSAYRVDVRIDPILDDAGRPLCFVAREQKLPDNAGSGAG